MYSSSFRFCLPFVELGDMPSFSPRRPLALASWRGAELAVVNSFVKPPWWRMDGGGRSTAVYFFNKRLLLQALWISLLLLAGLGGEGEKMRDMQRLESSGYPGGEADALLECKSLASDAVPWRNFSASGIERRFFNNCPFCVEVLGSKMASILCRGGNGKEDWRLGSMTSWGAFWAAIFGDHQWRRICVAVILGQRGRSELWCCVRRSVFNLQAAVPMRRPFPSSTAAFIVVLLPSGFVPGGGADGHRVELLVVYGGEGSDCISFYFVEVLSIKAKGLVVISFYFEVLDVICKATV